jgi:hypothetical protein
MTLLLAGTMQTEPKQQGLIVLPNFVSVTLAWSAGDVSPPGRCRRSDSHAATPILWERTQRFANIGRIIITKLNPCEL